MTEGETNNGTTEIDTNIVPVPEFEGPIIQMLGYGQREKLIATAFQANLVDEVFGEKR